MLGRTDFRLIATRDDGERVFLRRQLEAALALRNLLDDAAYADWRVLDRGIGAFVGEHDYMIVPQLDELPEVSDTDQLMRFRIETLPAGTQMSTWLRLDRATPREVAFFTEVLEVFTRDGRIGGRAAIGHGRVATELTCTQLAGEPAETVDWRAPLLADPAAAITALQALA